MSFHLRPPIAAIDALLDSPPDISTGVDEAKHNELNDHKNEVERYQVVVLFHLGED